MRAAPKAFQNRARRVVDDGRDFEDFVFECFRVAKEERGLAKRLAKGRDGAIDLIDRLSEPGGATVTECKYIGSGEAKEATERWTEVYRNLCNNLPKLHANPTKAPKSPYRGWLDPTRPVTRYRFCVTAEMTDQELATLEKRIAADFARLVEDWKVEPLQTLAANADGAIRVLRWDWFDAVLQEHPSLAFRWFHGLPAGVELFKAENGARPAFRDFLTTGELRYFSRDDYEQIGVGSLARRERELVADLAEGKRRALLIIGPGGVGKTRLAWEIAARLLEPEQGFDIYCLSRSADFHSVKELALRYPGDAGIALLVDYAEAASSLSAVVEAIEHVTGNSGHRLRLIATCRASAANEVKDALRTLAPEEKSLSSSRFGEEAYVRWVARSILDLEDLPDRESVERVCRGVPALAAFAIFLFRRHPEQFDAQFGALHGEEDFDNWTGRRIGVLVSRLAGDRRSAERMLARIALMLPLPVSRLDALVAEGDAARTIIGMLLDDRWIEREGDQYVAAHDVLADALAARWLFETDSVATQRMEDLLLEFARDGELNRALVALERLASDRRFAEIDGRAVLDKLVAHYPDAVTASYARLFSGSLLSRDEKADQDEAAEVAQAAEAAKASRDPLLAWLATDGSTSEAQRIYRKWLDAGRDIDAVSEPLLGWLAVHGSTPEARFVYLAWLDAGGAIEAVTEPFQAWVSEHGNAHEAAFVYVAWLKAGGAIELVTEPLHAWVSEYRDAHEAAFVYVAWLKAGGAVEAVFEPLLGWLHMHHRRIEANFVFNAWLDRGGAKDPVFQSLLSWIGAHGQSRSAGFLYRSWLDAGGDFEPIREQVFAWVLAHRESADLAYLSKRLVRMRDLPEAIILAIAKWCATFATHEDSLYRLFALCGALQPGSLTGAGVTELMSCIERVAPIKMGSESIALLDRVQLWGICVAIGRPHIFNLNPYRTVRIIAGIVASGKVFDADLSAGDFSSLHGSHTQIAQMVVYGLRWEELGTGHDSHALMRFADWVRESESDFFHASQLFDRLNTEFPSAVWR